MADYLHHVITGGAGFIGSHLADALVADGDQVTILDNLSTGRVENIDRLIAEGSVDLVVGSVTDRPLVAELLETADTCFHLASAVGVQLIMDKPLDSLLENVRGMDIITECAAENDVRLLLASSSEIYGKLSDGALHEESDRILGPPSKERWTYATAKAFGEMLALGYHRQHGAETIVTRFFNTVGPRQASWYGMVLPRFVSQALAGNEITVYGSGDQSRCFTHVYDSVDALMRLIKADDAVGRVFNVGHHTEVTITELAEEVISRTESTSTIRYVPYEEAYGEGFEELGRRKPDTSAIEQLTGWRAERTISDAIGDLIHFQHRHPESPAHPDSPALAA